MRPRSMVWAIGFFDGCHLGHVQVFKAAEALGREKNTRWGILTFWPHPLAVLHPEKPFEMLQTQEDKVRFCRGYGAADIVFMQPTADLLGKTPDEFLRELQRRENPSGLVAGENFSFGHGAKGNCAVMRTFFKETKVSVREVPLLRTTESDGAPVSSTLIRRYIREGRMKRAAALLGRSYELAGTVVRGFQRGKSLLGYPTANLEVSSGQVIPADGVYATYAVIDGQKYKAVTNVGMNPTFGNRRRTVETFVIFWDKALYGRPFRLEWLKKLRDEQIFAGADELRKQIEKDIEKAETVWL